MKALTTIFAAAALAVAGTAASAASYTPDTLLGSATLANSGDATEIAALAGILGVDASTLSVDDKVTTGEFHVDDAGNYYYDVAPSEPGYFILKFGTGSTSADSHYFFQNIAELTKLVWTSAQINGLLAGCSWTGGDDCRLSHITTTPSAPAPVPLPATGLMLLGGLGAMALSRRRKAA